MGEWISVDDRLPEDGEIVVILCLWTEPFTGYRYDADWRAVVDHLDAYAGEYSNGAIIVEDFRDDYVTHWMPIPDLILEEEE